MESGLFLRVLAELTASKSLVAHLPQGNGNEGGQQFQSHMIGAAASEGNHCVESYTSIDSRCVASARKQPLDSQPHIRL